MGIVNRLVRRLVPRTRKAKWRVVVYGGAAVLLALDMGLVRWWRRVPVGVDTTRVTMVDATGYPDYLRWINEKYGAGVTRENNAAVGLLELSEYPGETGPRQALGLEHEKAVPMMQPSYGMFVWAWKNKLGLPEADRQKLEDERWLLARQPWKAAEHPDGARWVEDSAAGLAAFHEAVAKPRYFVPAVGPHGEMAGLAPGELAEVRPMYWRIEAPIVARAQMRAGEGDWKGFGDDVRDLLHFGTLLHQGWSFEDVFATYSVEVAALRAIVTASPTMPAADARALFEEVDHLHLGVDSMHYLEDWSRFVDLDQVQAIARRGFQGRALVEAQNDVVLAGDPRLRPIARALWPVPYAAYARQVNQWYDEVVAAPSPLPNIPLQKADGRKGPWWQWAARAVREDLTFDQPYFRQREVLAELAMARGALALRLYHEAHGAYPERLAEMMPAILSAVPMDPLGSGPLVYRREGAGFVLYSVGRDGVDDGGQERTPTRRGDEVLRVGG